MFYSKKNHQVLLISRTSCVGISSKSGVTSSPIDCPPTPYTSSLDVKRTPPRELARGDKPDHHVLQLSECGAQTRESSKEDKFELRLAEI